MAMKEGAGQAAEREAADSGAGMFFLREKVTFL